jgi:hypothetical protein
MSAYEELDGWSGSDGAEDGGGDDVATGFLSSLSFSADDGFIFFWSFR